MLFGLNSGLVTDQWAKRSKNATRRSEPKAKVEPAASRHFGGMAISFLKRRWRELLGIVIFTLLGFLIYSPSLLGDWLWDDEADISHNLITQSPNGLWSIWFQPGTQVDYYPIKASVQWIQWHLWRNDMLGYHLTNVVLHIVNALLVWRLFNRLNLRLAWLGGLIFLIHPANVESVAWIAELKNTLSMTPFLLAMTAYIDYEESHRARDYWLALGLFLAAMLTKTSMVMFPVVILLYVWWKRGRIRGSDLWHSAPFFAVSLLLGLVTVEVGHWYDIIHAQVSNPVLIGGPLSPARRCRT